MRRTRAKAKKPEIVRCAIYTRKSTEEGLQQEFNSLDAQRESGEAYVKSQQHEGWTCLPEQYDDGGFTGGNMDRPALKRLLADIEAGKIDCVVVYKVDRLSRSLLDFAKIMGTFEKHGVAFVSVTQQFNTSSSMGRLMLNILLSFAQFERELISERTRDKMGAARRKGKWAGGSPPLGYDVVDQKLVVNEVEAKRVREIFQLYLDRKSILAVVQELNRRGWTMKAWRTRKGTVRGGLAFNKNTLYYLLRNVTYIGKVEYEGTVYAGQHEPIVSAALFERVQTRLNEHGRSGGTGPRVTNGGLLGGLLKCRSCGCAMSHSHTAKGPRLYRYYVCQRAQKKGYASCPMPSVSAPEIERFVVDEIRAIGRDSGILADTLAALKRQADEAIESLAGEGQMIDRELRDLHAEMASAATQHANADRFAGIHERIAGKERRLREIHEEQERLRGQAVEPDELAEALERFDPVWNALGRREQNQMLQVLVDRVEFASEEVVLHFHPLGIRTLLEVAE